jgi:1,6-anhydro-N-acetylmuramate kinase
VSTVQLGDPSAIAVLTGVPTVGDFRVADVAARGQGAPITSTMDVLYLSPPIDAPLSAWRAVQNIGEGVCDVRAECLLGLVCIGFLRRDWECHPGSTPLE